MPAVRRDRSSRNASPWHLSSCPCPVFYTFLEACVALLTNLAQKKRRCLPVVSREGEFQQVQGIEKHSEGKAVCKLGVCKRGVRG